MLTTNTNENIHRLYYIQTYASKKLERNIISVRVLIRILGTSRNEGQIIDSSYMGHSFKRLRAY